MTPRIPPTISASSPLYTDNQVLAIAAMPKYAPTDNAWLATEGSSIARLRQEISAIPDMIPIVAGARSRVRALTRCVILCSGNPQCWQHTAESTQSTVHLEQTILAS